jgi:hypothetical protein
MRVGMVPKGAPGMNKFSSIVKCIVNRITEAWKKVSLLFKSQDPSLERLYRECVVDGATHSQKDGVEGNRDSL